MVAYSHGGATKVDIVIWGSGNTCGIGKLIGSKQGLQRKKSCTV